MTVNHRQDEVVRLLIENRSHLFAFIYAVVRDINAAEEVLQETSVAVCEHADQFASGTHFGAWSREIARRRILAYFRHKKAQTRFLSEDHIHHLTQAFNRTEDCGGQHQSRVQALRQCLATLTPRVRQWLHLRYVSQLPVVDIAGQVERTPDNVRKTLYRSRRLLRECIERRLRREERV